VSTQTFSFSILQQLRPSHRHLQTKYNFGTAPWLGWERVTRVPIQPSLVDFSLLSKEETQWLKDHNAQAIAEVMPLLTRTGDENARKWLKKQAL
jgi:Xaa-Pro aminopeptidase